MHGHGDCPGCIQPLVGHDADCEVMSEKVPPTPGPSCGDCGVEFPKHAGWCMRPQLDARQAQPAVPPCAQTTCPGWKWVHSPQCPTRRQAAPASPGAQQTPTPVSAHPESVSRAVELIRERLESRRELYEHYRQHIARMLEEHDAHACWDASVNLSEVSCYIDGLLFALEQLGEKP